MISRAKLVSACLAVVMCSLRMAGQIDASTNPIHTFEPSKWTPEDRIGAVENGLLLKPILVTGQPVERVNLIALMKERNVPGLSVAVVEDGKIAWAKGYGVADISTQQPVTPETLFNAGGITKVVTAVTALTLAEEGKIDLDEDVRKQLTSWKLPASQFALGHSVTLRQLLSHSSGFTGHFPASYDPSAKTPSLLQQLNGEPPAKTKPVEIGHQPGTTFEYSSAAFLVAQQVLSDVTGKPFPDIVQERVFAKVGMTHSTFAQPITDAPDSARATGYLHDKNGAPKAQPASFPGLASSGLWTTPSDLALLLINLQNSGHKGALLTAKAYNEMLTPLVNNAGLGVFLAGNGPGLYFRARGSDGRNSDGFSGWFVGYAHARCGAVILMNSNALVTGFALLRSIAQQYGWSDYIPVKTLHPISADVLSRYVGKYEVAGDPFVIGMDSGGLFAELGSGRKYPLLPSSENTFFINIDLFHEVQVCFLPHQNGGRDEIVLQYPYHSYKGAKVP